MRQQIAWVEHENRVYKASGVRQTGWPHAPVTLLIQTLFDLHKDLSFFILRRKIYTTGTVTDFERAMVFLAAKRVQDQSEFDEAQVLAQGKQVVDLTLTSVHHLPKFASNLPLKDLFPEEELAKQLSEFESARFRTLKQNQIQRQGQGQERGMNKLSPGSFAQILSPLLMKQLDRIERGDVRHDYNRRIAAAIFSREGELIKASYANNYVNKTLHAEVCCFQNSSFQTGCFMVVTLKPCRMCAEMAWHWSGGDPQFKIFFVEDDPGTKAQGSRLEREGQLNQISKIK
ncbi:MAG: Bd3614 family nucleic acid deaminase [Pseudobdellovibrionaceae bacterium]